MSPVEFVQELKNEIVINVLDIQRLVVVGIRGGQHVAFVVDDLIVRVRWVGKR